MIFKEEEYKGYLIKKRFQEEELVAVRIFVKEDDYVTYYLNGHLWAYSVKLYDINGLPPKIQEIIRDFDLSKNIRSNGELK